MFLASVAGPASADSAFEEIDLPPAARAKIQAARAKADGMARQDGGSNAFIRKGETRIADDCSISVGVIENPGQAVRKIDMTIVNDGVIYNGANCS
jgi:hypothetical protein